MVYNTDEDKLNSAQALSNSDNLSTWVDVLSQIDLPALNETVQKVSRLTSNIDARSSELAETILSDPSISAKILTIANSVSYNPSGVAINTISRAVIILGFDTIKNIALTVALLDSLDSTIPHKGRILQEVAQSFHAAQQAEAIAKEIGDPAPEEIYMAALLNHLGEMAFWASGSALADEFDNKLNGIKLDILELQKQTLGFTLKKLSQGLARSWNLGDSITEALNTNNDSDSRWNLVNLSHRFALEIQRGWDTNELDEIVKSIGKVTGKGPKATRLFLKKNTENAIAKMAHISSKFSNIAKFMVAPQDSELLKATLQSSQIAVQQKTQATTDKTSPSTTSQASLNKTPQANSNPSLQLSIIQELMQLPTQEKPDLNLIFQMTLEGLHRGVGMDRALMAILSPKRDFLKIQHLLESKSSGLRDNFQVQLNNPKHIFFKNILISKESVWIGTEVEPAAYKNQINSHITKLIGSKNGFIAPIVINSRPVGVFYADRAITNRELDLDSYNSFKMFVQIANTSLAALTGKRK
ncbi:MAG: hypothetical protein COC19_07840 [SAR86 cluster bacterium]|uniref:HDOD domain-containing protein n=1 Tax=SAR86 cluster bacterium TaxID=2030880 RepID=A0A2A4MFL0_9GAMM|nr:MAG: hypothetical protein COC19_07840 [SAR86 cluster bacterium]